MNVVFYKNPPQSPFFKGGNASAPCQRSLLSPSALHIRNLHTKNLKNHQPSLPGRSPGLLSDQIIIEPGPRQCHCRPAEFNIDAGTWLLLVT